jgi:hypothetical protein
MKQHRRAALAVLSPSESDPSDLQGARSNSDGDNLSPPEETDLSMNLCNLHIHRQRMSETAHFASGAWELASGSSCNESRTSITGAFTRK